MTTACYRCHGNHMPHLLCSLSPYHNLCLTTGEGHPKEVQTQSRFWWMNRPPLRPLKDRGRALPRVKETTTVGMPLLFMLNPGASPPTAGSAHMRLDSRCADHIGPGHSRGCYTEHSHFISCLHSASQYVSSYIISSISFICIHLHVQTPLGRLRCEIRLRIHGNGLNKRCYCFI